MSAINANEIGKQLIDFTLEAGGALADLATVNTMIMLADTAATKAGNTYEFNDVRDALGLTDHLYRRILPSLSQQLEEIRKDVRQLKQEGSAEASLLNDQLKTLKKFVRERLNEMINRVGQRVWTEKTGIPQVEALCNKKPVTQPASSSSSPATEATALTTSPSPTGLRDRTSSVQFSPPTTPTHQRSASDPGQSTVQSDEEQEDENSIVASPFLTKTLAAFEELEEEHSARVSSPETTDSNPVGEDQDGGSDLAGLSTIASLVLPPLPSSVDSLGSPVHQPQTPSSPAPYLAPPSLDTLPEVSGGETQGVHSDEDGLFDTTYPSIDGDLPPSTLFDTSESSLLAPNDQSLETDIRADLHLLKEQVGNLSEKTGSGTDGEDGFPIEGSGFLDPVLGGEDYRSKSDDSDHEKKAGSDLDAPPFELSDSSFEFPNFSSIGKTHRHLQAIPFSTASSSHQSGSDGEDRFSFVRQGKISPVAFDEEASLDESGITTAVQLPPETLEWTAKQKAALETLLSEGFEMRHREVKKTMLDIPLKFRNGYYAYFADACEVEAKASQMASKGRELFNDPDRQAHAIGMLLAYCGQQD